VCAARCYYAKGGSSWPAALKKQQRLLNSVKENPERVAKQIVYECRKKQVTYLRWNGGGDLFPESIEALHHVAEMEPRLPIWVVTRIPEMAAEIKEYPNVYVHFSLDKASLKRREQFESMPKKTKNYFFSYQCDKDETIYKNDSRSDRTVDYYLRKEKDETSHSTSTVLRMPQQNKKSIRSHATWLLSV
jgi:hypothetical protein